MNFRTRLLVVALAVLWFATVGIGLTSADLGSDAATVAPNATTGDVLVANETGATLTGTVVLDGNATAGTVRMEYRERTPDGGWQQTPPRKFSAANSSRDRQRFGWNVTGLEPDSTYEYRLRVTTSNDTDTGRVRTFETEERGDGRTQTRTPTLPPCPQYRGAGTLCTSTATPTDPPAGGQDADGPTPDAEPASPDDWLAGLLPLLSWAAVLVVVAPAVLGGLLWADWLRSDEDV